MLAVDAPRRRLARRVPRRRHTGRQRRRSSPTGSAPTILCFSAARDESVEALRRVSRLDATAGSGSIVLGGSCRRRRRSRGSSVRPTPTASSTSPSRGCASSRRGEPLAPGRPRRRRGRGRLGPREPLDQRLFRFPYSDIAILGKFVDPRAALARRGLGDAHRQRRRRRARLLGPLRAVRQQCVLVRGRVRDGRAPRHLPADAAHRPLPPGPRRPELPPMSRSGRAFAQATFRHLLFGVVLGLLVSV